MCLCSTLLLYCCYTSLPYKSNDRVSASSGKEIIFENNGQYAYANYSIIHTDDNWKIYETARKKNKGRGSYWISDG